MFVTDPAAFLAEFTDERYPMRGAATARSAFLVSPASSVLAEESARDNRYMDLSRAPDPLRALRQHAELARRLGADVPVLTFPGDPDCPDGMFPNNVFATARGNLIVGRMRHPVRQREAARDDIRGFFRDVLGARAMHEAFGLRLTFAFELAAGEYHTNVVLAVLAGRAVILAGDGFADPAVPDAIARAYGGQAVRLSPAQKRAFAGNAIALAPDRVWMSAAAAAALEPSQRALLERGGFSLGAVDLDEIEKAGGSLRCCVAEIF